VKSRTASLVALCTLLTTACGGDSSSGNGPTGPSGTSASFATVRQLTPRIGAGFIAQLKPTNDALYFDVNDGNAISVWRHYGDTVFARFEGRAQPIRGWTPASLDIEPPDQFSIYWTGGLPTTADLKELRFGSHSFGPIGVPDMDLWNMNPLISHVIPTISTEVTSRLVWGVGGSGDLYRQDRVVGRDTSTAQWFEPIYKPQEAFVDALAGIAAAAEGYLYVGGLGLHEIAGSGGYRKITLPGGTQFVSRLIYDGRDLWIGRMLDVFRMPIYPQRGEPTLVASVDGQFCVWQGRIYTSTGSVYTTGLNARQESWLTDKPIADLTSEERTKLQALSPTGGFGNLACSPFTDAPRLYATSMDGGSLPKLYEIIPVGR
jgi:hypothetical protein